MQAANESLIQVNNVSKQFFRTLDLAARIARRLGASVNENRVHAVDRVSFNIQQGEVFGLVGESGCGKSTLGRVIAGIHPPTEGDVFYQSNNIADFDRQDRSTIQMIFQDPQSSLNPRLRVRDIVSEGLVAQGKYSRSQRLEIVAQCLRDVGLDPSYMQRYPHQFSGGQRQRISIARALAVRPQVLVCDESIAALDVSIQAQVVNLFMQLRETHNLTYIFISHDIGVVQHICDRVGVMYLGRIVEIGAAKQVFSNPAHPYTRALLDSIPILEAKRRAFKSIQGEIPSPLDPPPGCHFHQRCPIVQAQCSQGIPKLETIAPDHLSACFRNGFQESIVR